MRDELKAVLDALPALTKAECGHVRAALMAVGSIGEAHKTVRAVAEAAPQSNDADLVLASIARHMRDRGFDMTGQTQLRASASWPKFRDKSKGVMKYVHKIGPRTNAQRAFLNIGVELLAEDLVKIGLATSSRLMMNHIHRLPGVVNRAFPGYMEAGLIHLIFREKEHARTE